MQCMRFDFLPTMFLELVHISAKDDQRDLTIDYRPTKLNS